MKPERRLPSDSLLSVKSFNLEGLLAGRCQYNQLLTPLAAAWYDQRVLEFRDNEQVTL